jgi:hypothetical protein
MITGAIAIYRRWVNRRTALRLLESSAKFTNPMFFYVNPCSYILANSFSLFVSVLAIIFVEIVLWSGRNGSRADAIFVTADYGTVNRPDQ